MSARIVWVSLLGVLFALAACDRPGAQDGPARIPLRDTGHAILLAVDVAGIEASRPRHEIDRWADLEWDNLLTQAFGGCDVADVAGLDGNLRSRQLLVLPRRTAARLGDAQIADLGRAVESGLFVLVEAPDSSLCKNFGLDLAAVERRPRLPWPLPAAADARVAMEPRPQPIEVPWTRMRYAPRPRPGEDPPRVQLSLDGRPLGWTQDRGRGGWIVLGMDLAELAARLRARNASGDAWLDAWVEGICGGAVTPIPLARVAPAPYPADGWLVLEVDATPRPATAASGAPAHTLTSHGLLADSLSIPTTVAADASGLDLDLVERRVRFNAVRAGGPVQVLTAVEPDSAGSAALRRIADRYEHASATPDSVRRWWEARREVQVRTRAEGDAIVVHVDALPPSATPFALLAPLRWRDRSLVGWDADGKLPPGRRAHRFDRDYRLIRLDPGSAGSSIRLRYR